MGDRPRRPYQVRAYLGADLYERILRDAAVQRRSVSECVREALEELYAIRDELSRPLEQKDEGSSGGRLAHRLLADLEERIAGGFSRQLDEIQSLGKQIRRLQVMHDRQYVGLMLYLPDMPKGEGEKRTASARRRYDAWRKAVEKLVESSHLRP